MRLVVAITARASYPRIRTALEACVADSHEVRVLAVGTACAPRYGDVSAQIEADGYLVERLPGHWDEAHPGGMVQMVGHAALLLGATLRRLSPDAVVTIADRFETLATAIAASYQNIPLIHVQGGEISGTIDDKVRNAITQLADVHCVATAAAGVRVREMHARGPVIVTGCPSIDLALRVPEGEVTLPGVGPEVDLRAPYLLVLLHPDTTAWERSRAEAAALFEAVCASGLPAIWMAPNADAGADGIEKLLRVEHERGAAPIRIVRHVSGEDFIRLLRSCTLAVGNSSAFLREGSALGAPVLLVGTRQQGREVDTHASVVPTVTPEGLAEAIRGARRHPRSLRYGDGHAGARIAWTIGRWWAARAGAA